MTSTSIETGGVFPDVLRFVVYCLIGILFFFLPSTINGTSTIPLDHLVTWIHAAAASIIPYVILLMLMGGAILPFATGACKASKVRGFFAFLNIFGLLVGCSLLFSFAPAWLNDPGMGPLLLNKLVIPVGLIVPVSSIFLALLVGYGVTEFLGAFCQPIMRPIWRTPGRSAVDAVASFVGSYSLGLLITDRMYHGIAEMFLPATMMAGQESIGLRMVIAIVCVSAIIFFSALVPCVLATQIPLNIPQMVVIWFVRIALTILIATPIVRVVS